MKITFIILGVLIAIFVIAHSMRAESKRADFMKFCQDHHIAGVGNMVYLKFKAHYERQCEGAWVRHRQGEDSEMVRKWKN